jgi:hypothetical protein
MNRLSHVTPTSADEPNNAYRIIFRLSHSPEFASFAALRGADSRQ